MYPVLLKLGVLEVHAYGFFLACAFLLGIGLALYYARREGIDQAVIFDLAIYVILAAIVGSRLFYVLGQWDYFRGHLLEAVMVQKGGLIFLGGLFLGLLVIAVYAWLKQVPLLRLLDAVTPGTLLGYALTRIGCFLNGCCFGLPTSCPPGVHFPAGSLADSFFPGEALHPTQLYSLVAMLLAGLLLARLYHRKKFAGQVFFWGLILYSLYRFGVEFLRFSPVHWLGLTPSQWLVLGTLVLGIWGLVRFKKRPA